MALDALVKLLDEGLKRGPAGVRPQRQLEHVDAAASGLAAADDVLADLHALCQLGLIEPSVLPQALQLLKEQLVLLGMKRVSHPAVVANATEQDQSEGKLWENAIKRLPLGQTGPAGSVFSDGKIPHGRVVPAWKAINRANSKNAKCLSGIAFHQTRADLRKFGGKPCHLTDSR